MRRKAGWACSSAGVPRSVSPDPRPPAGRRHRRAAAAGGHLWTAQSATTPSPMSSRGRSGHPRPEASRSRADGAAVVSASETAGAARRLRRSTPRISPRSALHSSSCSRGGMTPADFRNAAMSRTVARPVTEPGCGRCTTIRSSSFFKPTRDPLRSNTFTPQCFSALIRSCHLMSAGGGLWLIRAKVLRLIADHPPLSSGARLTFGSFARLAETAVDPAVVQ